MDSKGNNRGAFRLLFICFIDTEPSNLGTESLDKQKTKDNGRQGLWKQTTATTNKQKGKEN